MKKETIKEGTLLIDKIKQLEFNKSNLLFRFKNFKTETKDILWNDFFHYNLDSGDQPTVDLKEWMAKTYNDFITAMKAQIEYDYNKRINEVEIKIEKLK